MHRFSPLLSLALFVSACAPDGEPPGETPETGPLYAVTTRIVLPSGSSTMVAIVDSLEPGEIDLEQALELPGSGASHGNPHAPGYIVVGSTEEPTFTRYDIAADGTLSKQGAFSLAQFGLSRAPRSVVFASATKAYAISAETHQLFVFDPEEMLLEDTLDLGVLAREGYAPSWVFRAVMRGDHLLVPITWIKTEGDPGASQDSAIVVVDTTDDTFEVLEETRCGGLRAIFAGGDGDLYFSSSAGAPATWNRFYGDAGGSEPCIVRMKEGENALDLDFLARPEELAEGRLAVDFSPAGTEHLIFQALDESLFEISDQVTPGEAWSAAAWRFYSVPLADLEAGNASAQEVDLPPSALNALRFEVDGRYFVPQITAEYGETKLIDVTNPQELVEGPTILGSVGNFFRVR